MQRGSLVECIYPTMYSYTSVQPKTPYTVGNMFKCPCGCGVVIVNLNEIKQDIDPITGFEYGFEITHLRELQPPLDISELLKECFKTNPNAVKKG